MYPVIYCWDITACYCRKFQEVIACNVHHESDVGTAAGDGLCTVFLLIISGKLIINSWHL
jgi:hypothetical protein